MIEMDADIDEQVAGHQVIEADLGIRGRKLIIASGIAIPGWRIDSGDMRHEDARVNLRIPVDRVLQATAHVGLASVSNDDTAHVFAVDTTRVDADEAGLMHLTVRMSLLGEWSALSRFGYQVVALVTREANEISGTIRWAPSLFLPPDRLPSTIARMLTIRVSARTVVQDEGPFGGETETLDPLLPGEITAVQIADDQVTVRYRIENPPRNRPLRVTVDPRGFVAPAGSAVGCGPVTRGEDIFTLTAERPSKSGVDFEVGTWRLPR